MTFLSPQLLWALLLVPALALGVSRPGPAADAVCDPLHERGPAGEHRRRVAALAPLGPARPVSGRARGRSLRDRTAPAGHEGAAQPGIRGARDGRLGLDAGHGRGAGGSRPPDSGIALPRAGARKVPGRAHHLLERSAGRGSPDRRDHTLVRQALSGLEADGGTAIGDAVALATELRKERLIGKRQEDNEDGEPPLVVLLLSDGAFRRAPSTRSKRPTGQKAAESPCTRSPSGPTGHDRGHQQFGIPETIDVPPDRETLEKIARITGGATFFSAPTPQALEAVYELTGNEHRLSGGEARGDRLVRSRRARAARSRRLALSPLVQPPSVGGHSMRSLVPTTLAAPSASRRPAAERGPTPIPRRPRRRSPRATATGPRPPAPSSPTWSRTCSPRWLTCASRRGGAGGLLEDLLGGGGEGQGSGVIIDPKGSSSPTTTSFRTPRASRSSSPTSASSLGACSAPPPTTTSPWYVSTKAASIRW